MRLLRLLTTMTSAKFVLGTIWRKTNLVPVELHYGEVVRKSCDLETCWSDPLCNYYNEIDKTCMVGTPGGLKFDLSQVGYIKDNTSTTCPATKLDIESALSLFKNPCSGCENWWKTVIPNPKFEVPLINDKYSLTRITGANALPIIQIQRNYVNKGTCRVTIELPYKINMLYNEVDSDESKFWPEKCKYVEFNCDGEIAHTLCEEVPLKISIKFAYFLNEP